MGDVKPHPLFMLVCFLREEPRGSYEKTFYFVTDLRILFNYRGAVSDRRRTERTSSVGGNERHRRSLYRYNANAERCQRLRRKPSISSSFERDRPRANRSVCRCKKEWLLQTSELYGLLDLYRPR